MVYDNKRIVSKRIFFVFIEMINKDNKIETLEKANEKMSHDLKTKQEYMVNNKQKKEFYWKFCFSRNNCKKK